MTAKEVLRLLRDDGWRSVETKGSHVQLKHTAKPGRVTVPKHGGDIHPKTLNSIMKQAGPEKVQ
jgi:predicted RNA binding protein YcfA (HicA-like mRNA interferase family)